MPRNIPRQGNNRLRRIFHGGHQQVVKELNKTSGIPLEDIKTPNHPNTIKIYIMNKTVLTSECTVRGWKTIKRV